MRGGVRAEWGNPRWARMEGQQSLGASPKWSRDLGVLGLEALGALRGPGNLRIPGGFKNAPQGRLLVCTPRVHLPSLEPGGRRGTSGCHSAQEAW